MKTHNYTDGPKRNDLYYKLPGSGANHSTKRSSGSDKFYTDSGAYKAGKINAPNDQRSVATEVE